MTTTSKRVGLALLCLLLLPALAWAEPAIVAHVVRVTDGDSLLVIDEQGKKDRIRLWGLDAPEINQKHGQASKAALEVVVLNQRVEVQGVARDRYARLLAIVTVKDTGLNVNQYMVRSGNAWERGSKAWKPDEAEAKAERAGLWKYPNPLPPWEWRKQNPAKK